MALADQQCVPCRGGVPPLPRERIDALLGELDSGWALTPTGHLLRTYEFPDFAAAMAFANRVGDIAEAGPGHKLRFEIKGENSELKLYLHIRGNLEALVSRPVMYDLVELGEHIEIEGVSMFVVRSGGALFPVMRSDELEALSK